jgi:secreted trypsin-like serine protease
MEKNLQVFSELASDDTSIDLKSVLDPMIVGGTDAGPNDNPSQVALLYKAIANDASALFCGGTLIEPNFIVTAAHCSDFIPSPNDVQVLVGSRRLDGSGQRYNVANITIHPEWNSNTFDSDVAVWELSANVTGIPFATLATTDGNVGENLLATGWGRLSYQGESPIQLQRVQLPLVDRQNCNDENSFNGEITDNMLCAGYDEGGQSVCHGDSGGPLTSGANHSILTGITSWGRNCALPNYYGVFTWGFL